MNLVTIFTGVLMEWAYSPLVGVLRNLRLVIMLFLLMRLSNRIRSHLGIMTLITTIIVVLAGIIISQANSTLRLVPSGMVCGIHGSPSHIPVTETSSRRPLLDVGGGHSHLSRGGISHGFYRQFIRISYWGDVWRVVRDVEKADKESESVM